MHLGLLQVDAISRSRSIVVDSTVDGSTGVADGIATRWPDPRRQRGAQNMRMIEKAIVTVMTVKMTASSLGDCSR